ncbi:MAG: hypothetical protein ACK4WB_08255, partial [Desulfatiglandales bacterium]
KIQIFHSKMEAIQQDREDTRYYFEGEINRLVDLLDMDLNRLKEREIPQLMAQIEETARLHEDHPVSEYVKALETALHQGIVRTFDAWVLEEEERLNKEYARVSKRYSERCNEIIEAILKTSAELFDIKLELVETYEAISSDSSLYYMTGDPPKFFDLEGAFDFFSQKILPRKLSKALVLKDIIKSLPQKIDQNCGRVRWDFMNRIRKSFMDFRWELNQKIDATEAGIRQAIEKAVSLKRQGTDAVERAKIRIGEDMEYIRAIKRGLHEIQNALDVL